MAEPVNKWKLDKHIPIAVIVTVIGSALAGILIINNNTKNIERTRVELGLTNDRLEKLEDRTDKFTELLVRIDERLKSVVEKLEKKDAHK